MKTRQIEMYVGRATDAGGQGGEWWTTYVDIPADTPEDKIEDVARKVLWEHLEKESADASFLGVYHIPPLEEDDLTCAQCGSVEIQTRTESEEFEYGNESTPEIHAWLTADIPVRKCEGCGFEFTDREAELIMEGAVQEYRALKHLKGLSKGGPQGQVMP